VLSHWLVDVVELHVSLEERALEMHVDLDMKLESINGLLCKLSSDALETHMGIYTF
jgi:hypothetical protein